MSIKRYRTNDLDVSDDQPLKEQPVVRDGRVSVLIKVKVRSSPTMSFTDDNVVTTLPDGARVKIFGEENGFYYVKFGNIVGYCDKRFVTIEE